ncbi:MAG: AarF/UbiB family protein [Nostoc sp.]|uniref:ABC1 kinase family protein n=1 Tax=Nostoc sp. TaxID=1180 RepID=UPI002FFA72B7
MLQQDLIPIPLDLPPEKRPLQIHEISLDRNRTFFIVSGFCKLFGKYFFKRLFGSGNLTADFARELRHLIERAGGLMVKAGQLFALRLDLFPPEVCTELTKLQDRSQGFSFEYVKQVIEEELGSPLGEVFVEFEEEPFAAASVSQVHRARIATIKGMVVVKVQRPDAAKNFGQDLQLIQFILSILKNSGFQNYLDWNGISAEIRQIVQEEMDYRYEAANLEHMNQTLRKHNIYVPTLIPSHSRKRVLTTEYVPGILMSDYIRAAKTNPERLETILRINNIDPVLVGQRLFESFFRQMLEDNLFHGDLHPGNIMLLRDSRICLIDLGAVGSLDAHFLRYYKRSLFALAEKDYDRALDYSLMLCDSLPSENIEGIKAQLIQCYRQWDGKMNIRSLSYHEKSIGAIGVAAGTVMRKNRVSSSWQLLRVFRTWGSMDASLNYLIPNADYMGLIGGYFHGAMERMQNQLKQTDVGEIMIRLVDGLSEISDLTMMSMREKAVRRHIEPKKDFLVTLAGEVRKIVWCGIILGVWVFLHQHVAFMVSWLPINQYSAWANNASKLAVEVWVGLFLLLFYLLSRLERR